MPLYLADTSAWNRSRATAEIQQRWEEMVLGGDVAVTEPVALELLYSARGPADYAAFRAQLSALPQLPLDRRAVTRATTVQQLLARHSQHRGPKPMDVIIAAVAEMHEATILHYDRHFDAIARVTGQPAKWLARRGTLD